MSRKTLVPDFGPLSGVRAIDVGRVGAGPFSATYLAEFGAEVIHVETPPYGPPYADASREAFPYLPLGASIKDGVSQHWVQESRNKLSLALDYTKPEGRQLLLRLVKRSDIFLESSRPGTFTKLGLDDDCLLRTNPRLVVVHVSGFGQTGPYSRRPSYDLVTQAFSGFLYGQGFPDRPPTMASFSMCDYLAAAWCAFATLAAYLHSRKTRRGQVVDLAMYEVVFRTLENMCVNYFADSTVRERWGNSHPLHFPYGVYQAADAPVVIAAPFIGTWRRLADLLSISESKEWDEQDARIRGREKVDTIIDQWVRNKPAKEVEKVLLENNIPCSVVYNMKDIANDEHYNAREMLAELRAPGLCPCFQELPGRFGEALLGWDKTTKKF